MADTTPASGASPIPISFPPSLQAFAEHRSIRYFLPQPLAPGHLALIVEAGRRAPTDAQGHMYTFVRIVDRTLRDHIATLCANQQHIREAAEFFVVCLDVYRLRLLVESRGGEWGMRGAHRADLRHERRHHGGAKYAGGGQNARLRHLLYRRSAEQHRPHRPRPPPARTACCHSTASASACRIPNSCRPCARASRASSVSVDDRYPETFPDTALESAYAAMSAKHDWYASLEAYFVTGGTMQHREPVMARAWRQQGLEPRPARTGVRPGT